LRAERAIRRHANIPGCHGGHVARIYALHRYIPAPIIFPDGNTIGNLCAMLVIIRAEGLVFGRAACLSKQNVS
jgi:hypothetical protein